MQLSTRELMLQALKFMLSIMFSQSKYYVDNLAENVKRGLRQKVRRGVMIGAGAKILGNIEIGEGAKVGAGSIVLHPVAPHTTVVGNPARQVGKPRHARPALDMDQSFDGDS